jgi:predicted nuclease of predicted toxin-antitoxin system
VRWPADENFNHDIVRALRRRLPSIDLVRVQDVGLEGASDPTVLEWASAEDRVLLTHDVSVLDDLVLVTTCSTPSEWQGQVIFLPLR